MVRKVEVIASTTFATPTVLWASTEGHIGNALTILFGSYITIVSGLATVNTAGENTEAGESRVALAVIVAIAVVLFLAIVGVVDLGR